MKRMRFPLLVYVLLPLFGLAPLAGNATDEKAPPPIKYVMSLAHIFEDKSTEYVFVVNGVVGFKTVASLEEFVGRMPPDSILEWSPGCLRFGNEPLLSSQADMNDFKAYCESKHVKFVLVPSG